MARWKITRAEALGLVDGARAWRVWQWRAGVGKPRGEPGLARLADSVQQIRLRTEPEFLQLSSDLQALHAGATELSRTTCAQVNAVRNVLADSRLTGDGGLADRFLAALKGELNDAENRAQTIAQSGAAMGRLRGCGVQIERLASLLDISGYSFAVESARSIASQQAFESFVRELRRLAGRVRTLGDNIAQQAEASRTESEQLGRAVGKSRAGLRELTSQAEAAVRQTSERVEQAIEHSWTMLQEAEQRTARIAQHVGNAVYHLQFGDIVRQKLEHIEAALRETPAELHGQVLPVQAGQLELVVAEVASSHARLEGAFAGLAEEARSLVGTVTEFGVGGKGPGQETDPIGELRAAFIRIEELRRHGRELDDKAAEISARAVEAASCLSRYLTELTEINQQMHLQALNAVIKTTQLGSAGQTLEVLSMHVQRVFEQSTGLVTETMQLIDGISNAASACAAPAAAGEDASVAPQQKLEQLAVARQELHDAMELAAERAAEQQAKFDRARVSLAFLTDMARDLEGLQGEVAAISKAAGARPAQEEYPDMLGERYTIASEREVHRRIASAAEAPADRQIDSFPNPAAPPQLPDADESLGDNVELF
ncbi:MAG TPA: hypothetical protein VMU80_17975 [Bryobacteraceae bacterium]|nr:hypothetical protein [Bryobacteraceae bacterium]